MKKQKNNDKWTVRSTCGEETLIEKGIPVPDGGDSQSTSTLRWPVDKMGVGDSFAKPKKFLREMSVYAAMYQRRMAKLGKEVRFITRTIGGTGRIWRIK